MLCLVEMFICVFQHFIKLQFAIFYQIQTTAEGKYLKLKDKHIIVYFINLHTFTMYIKVIVIKHC